MLTEKYSPPILLTAETGYEYWKVVNDKSVLEIGPYDGWYTKLMLEHSPKSYTVIEANEEACGTLSKAFKDVSVIHADAVLEIDLQNKEYDVVVVLGVLYHLASPLHLLERIVNVAKPSTIVLDVIGHEVQQHIIIGNEPTNVIGHRYSNERVSGLSITLSETDILTAMKNMGYEVDIGYAYNEAKKYIS